MNAPGLDDAIRRAFRDRRRRLSDAAAVNGGMTRTALEAVDERFIAEVRAAAGKHAAVMIEECARSPYSQRQEHHQRGAA